MVDILVSTRNERKNIRFVLVPKTNHENFDEVEMSVSTEKINNNNEGCIGVSLDASKAMVERVKTKLRMQLGEDIYNSWFKGLAFESLKEDTVTLSVSTLFLRQWIDTHYADKIVGSLQEECESIRNMVLTVRGTTRAKARPTPKSVAKKLVKQSPMKQIPAGQPDDQMLRRMGDIEGPYGGAPLDPKFVFDTFCPGEANQMAFAAARAIATGDRSVTFNPMFVHAKVGLGKTHLLQAIAWESQRARLNRRVLYFTCERFMQKLREGFANKTIADIKERMRDVDVMIIDDIQFLAGEKFQQEFSHLIMALVEGNKQVILSADRPAASLETIDEHALSRLRGGITLELQSPDHELRRKILNSRLSVLHAADPSIDISDLILEYVAKAVKTNGRDLEGALNRLVAQQCYTGAPVTMESAQLVLRDLVRCNEPRKVMVEDIQRTVATHFSISKSDLVSQRRTRAIVRPRQIAMYLCKVMTPRSLPEIGKRFGGRDHTTVIHAVQKVEQLMVEDSIFCDDVELLKRVLTD